MPRPKVYIAGPYTSPDPAINTRRAMEYWHRLWDLGFAPYCPHLTHFLHLHQPRPYSEWLEMDNEWVAACEYLFRFSHDQHSTGADEEWKLAAQLGLRCFKDLDELVAYARAREEIPNTTA